MAQVEYDIRTIPETAAPRSLCLRFADKWTTPVAKVAKAVALFYLFVRAFFLFFGASWWSWATFYFECVVAFETHRNQAIVIAAHNYGDPNTGQHRERLRLLHSRDQGTDLPLVDILITCCGERAEVILDTVRGACQVDYPPGRFRVLLLDDGRSSALRQEILQLRKTWPHLQYHSRIQSTAGQHVFSKAGNLNYALFDIQGPMKQPPEFITVLDADFIPAPHFLRATLPHLLRHPQLAIVGACQDFYNLPLDDPLDQSLDDWQRRLVPQLNQFGACFHGHSGAVIRRSILMEQGGFPTISFSEDVLISNILLGSGFQIISLPEMLQLGRSPESLQGHIAQRTRWGVGLIQLMLCLKNTPQNPVPANLRWGIAYQSAVILFVLVNRTAMQIFVPLALFSGQPLVPASSPLQFKGQGILALMFVASGWLFDWLFTAKSGFHGFVFGDQREIWLSWRYLVVLFKYLFDKPRSSGSAVTGSTLNPWNHNDTGDRFAGLKRDLWDAGVMVNVLSFFAVCSAMLYAMIYTKERHGGILVGLAWPPILHMCYLIISSNWIPLACTFSPPVWENPMTAAMKPGDMDSRAMFSQTDLQRTLRPAGTRPPLGRANHYALLPVILVGLGLAVLSYCFGD